MGGVEPHPPEQELVLERLERRIGVAAERQVGQRGEPVRWSVAARLVRGPLTEAGEEGVVHRPASAQMRRLAAVDDEQRPGDEARVVGQQEADRRRQLVRLGDALLQVGHDRSRLAPSSAVAPAAGEQRLGHAGAHPAGRDAS